MDLEQIIEACDANSDKFDSVIGACSNFEIKGVFHSEMLAFVSITSALGCDQIVESGRARGQSTEVIVRFFEDRKIRFDSIEFDRWSDDASIATARLAPFKDRVVLHFGDANQLLPRFVKGRSIMVLIDGPKGFEALLLAAKALKIPQVRAVAIHDLPKESSAERGLMEAAGLPVWFSDQSEFVDRYRSIDDVCWKAMEAWDETAGWRPYTRNGVARKSYAATLGFVFKPDNSPETMASLDAFEGAAKSKLQESRNQATFLHRIAASLPSLLRQTRVYRATVRQLRRH